jgi:hypothetical protein
MSRKKVCIVYQSYVQCTARNVHKQNQLGPKKKLIAIWAIQLQSIPLAIDESKHYSNYLSLFSDLYKVGQRYFERGMLQFML